MIVLMHLSNHTPCPADCETTLSFLQRLSELIGIILHFAHYILVMSAYFIRFIDQMRVHSH